MADLAIDTCRHQVPVLTTPGEDEWMQRSQEIFGPYNLSRKAPFNMGYMAEKAQSRYQTKLPALPNEYGHFYKKPISCASVSNPAEPRFVATVQRIATGVLARKLPLS